MHMRCASALNIEESKFWIWHALRPRTGIVPERKSIFVWKLLRIKLLPPAIRRMGEGNSFSLFTSGGGTPYQVQVQVGGVPHLRSRWGGTWSQVQEGYPISGLGGLPHLRSGGYPIWGVPHLRSGGYPIWGGTPSQVQGVPHLRSGGYPIWGVPHLRSGGYPIWGGTPSQVQGVPHLRSGGYPIWGVPHLRSGGYPIWGGTPSQVQGVPHLRSGGYPISGPGGTPSQVQGGTPSQVKGVPHLRSRGGTPSQVWSGGGTPSQVWSGGYSISGPGGTPSQVWGGTRSTPPGIASTCYGYAAGGVPLAFTQEDFLVMKIKMEKWNRMPKSFSFSLPQFPPSQIKFNQATKKRIV